MHDWHNSLSYDMVWYGMVYYSVLHYYVLLQRAPFTVEFLRPTRGAPKAEERGPGMQRRVTGPPRLRPRFSHERPALFLASTRAGSHLKWATSANTQATPQQISTRRILVCELLVCKTAVAGAHATVSCQSVKLDGSLHFTALLMFHAQWPIVILKSVPSHCTRAGSLGRKA